LIGSLKESPLSTDPSVTGSDISDYLSQALRKVVVKTLTEVVWKALDDGDPVMFSGPVDFQLKLARPPIRLALID
jgi:hypothetical protein